MEINTRMKKYHHYLTLLSLFMLLGILKLQAAIQLPAIFSNHMVLQRNSELTFWGWGIPGETISIAPEWMKGEIIKTQVNNTGKWSARVPSGEAGGPYEIRFSGSSEVTLTDVMLGEVWLCSGQSNMEWSANHGIKNGDEETANAHCPNLRIFHVARIAAPFPQENCFSQWTQCTPETMRSTSALAYFFGRNIQEELDVPVGIIVAAWGGTTAETWTPRECVMSDPVLCDYPYESNPWFPAETGTLYNSMIYPVMPYGIAGCIWYQGESLCRFLRENKKILDVLFLDIELLTTNGIEVGRFIREEQENMETAIVYISANSSYAMDLFRVQPTDFLIKPLDKIKVGNVMNRIQKISEVRKGIFEYFGSGYYFKVLYKDILYFSSQNKKVHLVLKDGQKEFNGKLKEIAKKIPGNFIQIHQSYLINFDYIEECSYESVKMKNGDTIPISQPYRKSVRTQLAERVWRERE